MKNKVCSIKLDEVIQRHVRIDRKIKKRDIDRGQRTRREGDM